jgi:hypothetical protein
MQDLEEQETTQREKTQEDTIQEMDLEKVEIDMKSLREGHGEQEINDMTIGQLRNLQSEIQENKGKEVVLGAQCNVRKYGG